MVGDMISLFDLFRIGIGPSSSHTVGPMRAAARFAREVASSDVNRISVHLYGSLAWTGRGHATDQAVILGLLGYDPETVEPAAIPDAIACVRTSGRLALPGANHVIPFDPATDIVFDHQRTHPEHPNALRLVAYGASGAVRADQVWLSIGGGFIVPETEAETQAGEAAAVPETTAAVPYPFVTGADLLRQGRESGRTMAAMMLANEAQGRSEADVLARLDHIAAVMMDTIERGLRTEGELPGGLRVRRRAGDLARRLALDCGGDRLPPMAPVEHVGLWAMAVNEENAAGGRIVTAPTNGAAGVVPAVLRHALDGDSGESRETARTFLLTAAAIGILFKTNASISGAEVGCQGEVGVASSMAAAGLTAVRGGSNEQIENAAEIAMEHHLGLTCDPVAGLVQVPCIERNAFGAVKAVVAALLALRGDGVHRVSLDQVMRTMRETGADMQDKYKETARGGLAVNVPSC